MIKKIVVIGPESTGKSTLCEQLAAHFKTAWVPEFARTFLETHGTDYTYDDLFSIAEGQMRTEDEMAERFSKTAEYNKQLFIDTDLYVIKVWSEFVFNKCDNRILSQIAARQYDLYLLCNTDLEWVKDNLREYPDLETRDKLFHFYKDAMVNQFVSWVIIQGNHDERLQLAIDAVNNLG